ncbi:hypothetical protein GS426_05850 [Rhodococcus hoagii]|nr:hypothetical protein [Prescottella equi]
MVAGLRHVHLTVVVKPGSFMEWLAKGVPWAILTSRFKYWHEAAQAILADGELSLQWRRWFEGDPLPWPGAKLRHGALVVWVEDKSGVEAGTSNGGTIFDGLVRTIRSYTEDFVENIEETITDMPVVGDYRVPGDRRTDPRVPYVYYSPDSPGVIRSSFKQRPARAVAARHGRPLDAGRERDHERARAGRVRRRGQPAAVRLGRRLHRCDPETLLRGHRPRVDRGQAAQTGSGVR